ncbi:hypothetical protein [uncultured Hymenobacter sp.]|uniref:hypothetical protein n=1 Tax=uncultured Hymenobacter sp. TaxID=170016 RepID=UPI0035CA0112
MRLLPRLLGLGLLSLLFALLTMSCETSRRGTEEYVRPDRVKAVDGSPSADERPSEVASRQIAQLSETGQMEYKTSQSELARAFIRQFGDGTVIDKVMVRKAPGKGQEAAGYFLVGLGLRSGMFRAMALPLQNGGDNTFSLSSAATRYIISGVGCNSCTFNFEGTRIVGTTCADNSGGSRCDLRVEPTNSLFTRRPGAAPAR